MKRRVFAAALLAAASAASAQDDTVVLGNNGASSYFVTSTTDAAIAPTGSGSPNPEMSLLIGKRYRFTFSAPGSHPFALLARGSTFATDNQLYIQGASSGSLEPSVLPGVDWNNASPFTNMDFTLTPGLADAMAAGADGAGYRCAIHTSGMRGRVAFRAQPSPFLWSTSPVTETFENAILGASIEDAFDGWGIVTDAPANYLCTIGDQPASRPGQAAGSTRWLTIADTHDANSVQDRLYPSVIFAPPEVTVAGYMFTTTLNVESIGSGPVLVVAQHDVDGAYRNIGGFEITAAGVSAIIVGANEGGNGAATSVREQAFGFADANFGTNQWITVMFHVDLDGGMVHVEAIGSDGISTASAEAMGLDLQGNVDPRNFRLCIRNNGAGNTSQISYDNITFLGLEGVPSGANGWTLY